MTVKTVFRLADWPLVTMWCFIAAGAWKYYGFGAATIIALAFISGGINYGLSVHSD